MIEITLVITEGEAKALVRALGNRDFDFDLNGVALRRKVTKALSEASIQRTLGFPGSPWEEAREHWEAHERRFREAMFPSLHP